MSGQTVRYNFPVKIVVLNNGGIGPGMPEIPENPMFNMKPNSLLYGARHDPVMEVFGGKGFFVEDPKHIRGVLDEAMNHGGPAVVNIVLLQGSPESRSGSAGIRKSLTRNPSLCRMAREGGEGSRPPIFS